MTVTSVEARRVGFLHWDSDEERERSRKGAALRQTRKQQKMARRQEYIRSAEEAWNALIAPSNEGIISDFVANRESAVFFVLLQGLFAEFRRSTLWARLRNPGSPPYTTRDMLHHLRRSGVSFAELRQADTAQFGFVERLGTIGNIPVFRERFIRPAVSASSSEDSQDALEGRGRGFAARRRRDEGEDPDGPGRRRRRQG
jgi:hypothetical protein